MGRKGKKKKKRTNIYRLRENRFLSIFPSFNFTPTPFSLLLLQVTFSPFNDRLTVSSGGDLLSVHNSFTLSLLTSHSFPLLQCGVYMIAGIYLLCNGAPPPLLTSVFPWLFLIFLFTPPFSYQHVLTFLNNMNWPLQKIKFETS